MSTKPGAGHTDDIIARIPTPEGKLLTFAADDFEFESEAFNPDLVREQLLKTVRELAADRDLEKFAS